MAMTSSVKGGDYPGSLEEKEGALQSIEEFIKGLEAQLIAARDTRQTILKDIALFKASRAPMAKVPLDVLPLIFEMWHDDPFVRNRTVGLVCKKWFNIVWNSARFWDRIVICPTWEVNKLGPLHRFVQLCHQKTNERSLDVVMDFSAIMSYGAYLGKILDLDPGRFNFTPFQLSQSCFARQARPNGGDQDDSDPYQQDYDKIVSNFVETTVRRDWLHPRRWRSLRVKLPRYWDADQESDAARLFIHSLEYMTRLVEITIKGRRNYGNSRIEIPPRVPSFPNLHRLTTNQDIYFDHIKIDYSALEHLCLDNFHASGRFICTAQSKFVALTSLVLDCSKDWRSLGLMPLGIISLPRLVSLTIVGELQATMEQMDAPNLASLHLEAPSVRLDETFTCPTSPLFSGVTSLVIKGTATMTLQEGSREPKVSYDEIYKALKQSPVIMTLKVEKESWGDNENVKKLVEDVREAGFPLLYLKEIIIVETDFRFQDMLTQNKARVTVLEIAAPGAEMVN